MWCSVMRRRRPSSACCRCISPAASRPRAAISSRSSRAAAEAGLYSNLITAAVLLEARRGWRSSPSAGSTTCRSRSRTSIADNADRIGAYRGGHAKKLESARWVRELGLPLTINAPIHRQNIDNCRPIIELAVELGAQRLEIAHVQYYGWALTEPRRR